MKQLLTNHRDQPVELHLREAVKVVGPRQTIEIDEADARGPQISVLVRHRHLTLRAIAGSEGNVQGQPKKALRTTRTKGQGEE